MKKIFISVLLVICLGGQAQENARMIRANDPNKDPNWIWYQEYTSGLDMYYEVIGQSTPVKVPAGKQTPFFTSGHPLNTVDNKKDMWPEDGWVLAYRDFGSVTNAPAQPFFVLYNKYRGILRYMFYNAQNISYTYYRAELSFVDPLLAGALMTFSDDEKAFLNDYDAENTLNFMGKAALFQGWGYADFQIFGYDPTMNVDSRIRIQIWGIDESTIGVESTEFTLNQVLDDADLEGSKSSEGNLKEAFDKGQKFYKSSEKAIKAIKDKVNTEQKKIDGGSSKPWWFDKLSRISNSSLASAVPYMAGLAGVVNSFFFSNDASPKPLKLKGSLKLKGTISNTKLLISHDFILTPDVPPTSQYYIPLNDFSLGVFNLVNKPIVLWDQESQYFRSSSDSRIFYYAFRLKNRLNYTFNHSSGLSITSMNAGFTFKDHAPIEPKNPILLESIVNGGVYDITSGRPNSNNIILPSGIFVEIKFQTDNNKNNGNEIIVIKNFPITISEEPGSLFNSVSVNPYDVTSLFKVPDIITLNSQNDYKTYSFKNVVLATNTVEAGGDFYVGDDLNNVELLAGNEIILTPNFQVNYGSNFRAIVPSFDNLENGRFKSHQSVLDQPYNSYFKNFNMFGYSYTPDFRDLEVIYEREMFSEGINKKNNQENLLVYPNPSRGNVNIEYIILSKNSKLYIEVVDQQGSKVYSEKREFLYEGTYQIPLFLSELTCGVYFVRIISNNSYRTGRILIID